MWKNSMFVCESSYVWINMKKERFSCEFLTFEGRNLDISDTYSSLFLILRRISTSYLCHCGSYMWEVGQAIESETYLRTYICQKSMDKSFVMSLIIKIESIAYT